MTMIQGEDLTFVQGKIRNSGILDYLLEKGFPENVSTQAESIYHKLGSSINKGKSFQQRVFYCVYQAHKLLKITEDPKSIAEKLGMKYGIINKALSSCSEIQTGYKGVKKHYTPLDFIPEICRTLGFMEENIQVILDLGQRILDRDRELYEETPQKIAAGIVVYYSTINGINLKGIDYKSVFHYAELTVRNLVSRLAIIDNS